MDGEFKAAPWGTRIWIISVAVPLLLLGIIPAIMLSIPGLIPLMQWLIMGMMVSIVGITRCFSS